MSERQKVKKERRMVENGVTFSFRGLFIRGNYKVCSVIRYFLCSLGEILLNNDRFAFFSEEVMKAKKILKTFYSH
jgi:hypothetical protein